MDKKRIFLICGILFLLSNSLYLGRNLIPGVTNGSIKLHEEFDMTQYDFTIRDFEIYDNYFYLITDHFAESRYNLTKIDQNGNIAFSLLFYSYANPGLISVNSNGILLKGSVNPTYQLFLISHLSLGGDVLSTHLYEPFLESNEVITGAFIYEYWVFGNYLYSLLKVSTSAQLYSSFEFISLRSWDFASNSSYTIQQWSGVDAQEIFSIQYYAQDSKPFIVIIEEESEIKGNVISYELSPEAISNRESHISVLLPDGGDVGEMKIVGFDEIYVTLPIYKLSYGLEILELATGKSELITFDEDVVLRNELTLEVHHDILLVGLSVNIDYKNSFILFSLEKRGNTIFRENFDTEMFDEEKLLAITNFEFSGDNLYVVVQEISSSYKIYKFSHAYSGPILIDSIPPFIQFNIIPILLTGAISGYKLWNLRLREDVDDMEYPSNTEKTDEKI